MTERDPIQSEPIRILLVDDEEGFITVLAKRLEKKGIHVTTALSGSEAILKFRQSRFDLVLLDLKMEFMDGIEVLKMLKEMEPETPVIMITGHGSLEDAQKGIEFGALECLPKPYGFEDLLGKIHAVCGPAGGKHN
jgi:DNA-binding response OmpR family regulator